METIEKIILNDVITECRIKALNNYLKNTKLPIRIYKRYKNTEDVNWINFINWVDELPYNYIFAHD